MNLNEMVGSLARVGHMTDSESFPGYPVLPTPTSEGTVWISLQPLSCRLLGFLGEQQHALEIKGSLGTIKAGKILTGKDPTYHCNSRLGYERPAITLTQTIWEWVKKTEAFTVTIVNLFFVLPLAQTLSQTLLLKGR